MSEEKNILGCFVSSHASLSEPIDVRSDPGAQFRPYIWGENGICKTLKKLNHEDYGKDLILILFQFYVKPIPYLLGHLKEIERYRRKERAIGITIVINDDNFFKKSEYDRERFLVDSILSKLNLLEPVIKRNQLDTNLERLRIDLTALLKETPTS